MKKLFIAMVLILALTLSLTSIQAAETTTDPPADETTDVVETQWYEELEWASLQNFIVSIGGVSILAALWRIRKAYKFIKSPDGTETIYKHVEKFLGRIVDKPQLIMGIVAAVSKLPVFQELIQSFQRQATNTEAVLRAEILRLSGQIDLNVYEGAERDKAVELLAELRKEYENIQTSG